MSLTSNAFADVKGNGNRARSWAKFVARWPVQAQHQLLDVYPTIECPTLLLWGGADPISPPAVGRRLLGLLPNARLHVVAGAGHDLAQTHGDEAASAIGEHLG